MAIPVSTSGAFEVKEAIFSLCRTVPRPLKVFVNLQKKYLKKIIPFQVRQIVMLYEFLYPMSENFQIFNVFKYITFRTGGAILTSLIISFIFGPLLIQTLKNFQKEGQPIRIDGPSDHIIKKKGTPTMGGILIL